MKNLGIAQIDDVFYFGAVICQDSERLKGQVTPRQSVYSGGGSEILELNIVTYFIYVLLVIFFKILLFKDLE